jgi:hypothetical protein
MTICIPLAIAAASVLLLACGGEETADPPKAELEAAPASNPAPEPPQQPAPDPNEAPPRHMRVTEKEMTPDGETLSLKGNDPKFGDFEARIGKDVEMLDDYPEDVPILPGGTLMATMAAEGHGSFINFKSEEPQEDIYNYYVEQLTEKGWTVDTNNTFRGQLSITSTKDVRKVVVNIAGTEGDARVSIIITDEK